LKSKSRLEAKNAALRQQLIVLRRKVHGRVRLNSGDRLFLVQLYRWFPSILKVMTIVRPETVVRWHRSGFRRYWRWKSRSPGGRPPTGSELRALIRLMSHENPLWGAPRIHGELLKLGFVVAQSTVAKYMARRSNDPCGQSWPTFVCNNLPQICVKPAVKVSSSRIERQTKTKSLLPRRTRGALQGSRSSCRAGLLFCERF
jgi:hypothetical protein